jgi:hypothetical protein
MRCASAMPHQMRTRRGRRVPGGRPTHSRVTNRRLREPPAIGGRRVRDSLRSAPTPAAPIAPSPRCSPAAGSTRARDYLAGPIDQLGVCRACRDRLECFLSSGPSVALASRRLLLSRSVRERDRHRRIAQRAVLQQLPKAMQSGSETLVRAQLEGRVLGLQLEHARPLEKFPVDLEPQPRPLRR